MMSLPATTDDGDFPVTAPPTAHTHVNQLEPVSRPVTGLVTSDPDEAARQNSLYAGRAAAALTAHAALTGAGEDLTISDGIQRLLADLRHLADASRVDYDRIDGDAEDLYTEETFGG